MSMEINVPPEMRVRYLSRRQKDIEVLRDSVEKRSMEEFERIGHQLKGNAASYGYRELEEIAMAMESAAKNKDLDGAVVELERFEKWLAKQATAIP